MIVWIKNRLVILIILLLATGFMSCQHKPLVPSGLWQELNEVLDEKSDSVLGVLKGMKQVESFTESDRANYYLLTLQAMYKSYQPLDSLGSSIDYLLTYYSSHKEQPLELSYAYLYKGRFVETKKSYKEAIECYMMALAYARKAGDDKLSALIYADLGSVYYQEDLLIESNQAYRKAYALSLKAFYPKVTIPALTSLGTNFVLVGKPDSALVYFERAQSMAALLNDSILQSGVLNNLATAYKELNQLDRVISLAALSVRLKPGKDNSSNYLLMGECFLQMERRDSARHYLHLSAQSHSVYTRAASHYLLYKLAQQAGDSPLANEHIAQYLHYYDSIYTNKQTLEIAQITYAGELDMQRALEHERQRNQAILFIVCFALLLAVVFSLFQYRERRKKMAEYRYKSEIQLQKQEVLEMEGKIARLENRLLQLQHQQVRELSVDGQEITQKQLELEQLRKCVMLLRMKCLEATPVYESIKALEKRRGRGNGVILNKEERDALFCQLDELFGDFMDDLKKMFPRLSREDLLFCCLIALHLPLSVIAACFGYSDAQVIRQRKYRMKDKILDEPLGATVWNQLFDKMDD